MKTRMVMGSLLATLVAFQVVAQRAENDDMYFNSKDREKLKTESPVASANDKIDSDYKAFKKKHFDKSDEVQEAATQNVNPTDSYSARTVNPEYISRSNSEQASEDEQNYYLEGYAPAPVYDSYSSGNYNNDNNNLNNNNWSNNNYGYGYGYGASAYNSWYSPYYGYCNPAMSPYYSGGPGWTMSLGYMWGSPGWNYGMSYGWGNSYYNPYSYYQPYGYGYPTYYYGGGSEAPLVNYGKRPSRHSAVVTQRPRSEQRVTSNSNGSRTSSRSRQTADVYYVKPYKRTTTFDNSSRTTRDLFSGTTDFPSTQTRTRSSSSSTPSGSRPSYSPPTRSSSSGGSAPTRSSGGSSSPKPRGGKD